MMKSASGFFSAVAAGFGIWAITLYVGLKQPQDAFFVMLTAILLELIAVRLGAING